jgi:hypothetical protein
MTPGRVDCVIDKAGYSITIKTKTPFVLLEKPGGFILGLLWRIDQ